MKKFTDTQQKSYAAGRRKRNARKAAPLAKIKMKLKKGDKVKVISGKSKGKTGEITRVFPRLNKVLIDGVNVSKRHTRARQGQTGHIAERPMPIHASNVAKTA